MNDVRIRPLERRDVRACADLHRRAFPGFFLTALGPSFLREFYAAFVDDADAIALVTVGDGDQIRGVVVGTMRPDGFFGRLVRRRWHAFARASVGMVLRSPLAIPRLVRALRYRGEVPVATSGALLSSISTDPGEGGGGRLLIEAFVEAVRARGVTAAYLTTDADDNDRVNEFYRRAGWQLAGDFITQEGRRMNCYTWHDGHPTGESVEECR